MKAVITNILNFLPFVRKYFLGKATIFMLHRVAYFEKNKLPPNENMKVSPQFLETFILDLKSRGYTFISLDRLYEILQGNIKVKKQIVLTLDDGYKDNYDLAYPIFKKHNIPFAIYLTTSFPDNKAILWWYVLEDLIIENNEIILGSGKKYICSTYDEKVDVFLTIRLLIVSLPKERFSENIQHLFSNYSIDWLGKCKDLSMSWDDIKNISKDNLCIIGGHTKNHLALNQLSEESIVDEVMEANTLIQKKINKKIIHFSYPFGSRNEVGRREFDIIKTMGFKTTTTTRRGNIYNEHRNHLECLPRIMLTENFDIKSVYRIRRKKIVTL